MQQWVTLRQVRKRVSLLPPPATMDPTDIPLPSSSEDEQIVEKKKKWHSFSDDEEEEDEEQEKEERSIHNLTRHLEKRLRDDKEY